MSDGGGLPENMTMDYARTLPGALQRHNPDNRNYLAFAWREPAGNEDLVDWKLSRPASKLGEVRLGHGRTTAEESCWVEHC